MKILISCSIVVETQLFVEKIAKLNQIALSFKKSKKTLSGKAIDGARFLTNNHQVYLLSAVGDDEEGQMALKWLAQRNFKTKFVETIKQNFTGEALVVTEPNGQSSITVYIGAGDYILPIDRLDKFSVLYLDSSIPLNTLYSLLKNKSENTLCLMDLPNKHQELDKKMLKHVDFFMPNRYETELFMKTKINSTKDAFKTAHSIAKFCPHNIIITLDKDGCILLNKQTQQYIPAPKKKIVDTIGAGDIFRGSFLNHYLKTNNILQSLKFATKTASFSVGIAGLEQSITKTQEKFKNEL